MGVRQVDHEGYRLIKAAGVLDGRTPESLEMLAMLSRPAAEIDRHHVVDLSGIAYINSTLLGLLVRFLSEAQTVGWRVLLLRPAPSVRNILDMTGLSEVMPIAQTPDEVIELLGEGGHQPLPGDLDFDILATEIEEIIRQGGEVGDDHPQLGRIAGKG